MTSRQAIADRTFRAALVGATLLFVAIIVGLFVELVRGSWESIVAFGPAFLWSSEWNPVTNHFGALPFIFGTVVSSAIAIVVAGVVGIAAAVFLAEFAPPRIARPISFFIELLAAVPSVVFGLWGLFVLAPFLGSIVDPFLQRYFGFLPIFQGTIYGIGLLAAGLLLALMIVPTVAAIARDLIVAVPNELREASMSLGATRWETATRVVLPAARAGIVGACVLALGRALGETIAVTMVIGNRPAISGSLFAPAYTLSSVIANEFTEATSSIYLSALLELGLILFLISIVVNGAARVMMWSMLKAQGRRP
ncbi:MAG TPA: phosphate ABC transporter permease subunit PstC [Candidatus Elarobacter sp.]|nr:phosphate ABC transporter permease subunit PstC [Candidatus Elarobacter sp.]